MRFYEQLRRLAPVKTFDPEELGGKGPVIWVYELAAPEPAEPSSDVASPQPTGGSS